MSSPVDEKREDPHPTSSNDLELQNFSTVSEDKNDPQDVNEDAPASSLPYGFFPVNTLETTSPISEVPSSPPYFQPNSESPSTRPLLSHGKPFGAKTPGLFNVLNQVKQQSHDQQDEIHRPTNTSGKFELF